MYRSLPLPEHLLKQLENGKCLQNEGYRGRFAPSPTGDLHLGNLRTALVSWLRARLANGSWLLRIDDLDTPRNCAGAIESLQADLLWLGLKWDGPVIFQSKRRGVYSSFLSALRKQGWLYPCRCSRKTLSELSQDLKLIYPGTCRNLALSWGSKNGKLPSWRLKVKKEFSNSSGDIVLRRSDGFTAYNFATVIDELFLGINEVVRGIDLQASVNAQLAIFDALGYRKAVSYRYAPLMLDQEGRKLSKRDGSFGLDSLKARSMGSSQVIGFLAETLSLVPRGVELTASELLSEIRRNNAKEEALFVN